MPRLISIPVVQRQRVEIFGGADAEKLLASFTVHMNDQSGAARPASIIPSKNHVQIAKPVPESDMGARTRVRWPDALDCDLEGDREARSRPTIVMPTAIGLVVHCARLKLAKKASPRRCAAEISTPLALYYGIEITARPIAPAPTPWATAAGVHPHVGRGRDRGCGVAR